MSPTTLVTLSADTLREQSRHGTMIGPVATAGERKWSAIAFLVILTLAVVAISLAK